MLFAYLVSINNGHRVFNNTPPVARPKRTKRHGDPFLYIYPHLSASASASTLGQRRCKFTKYFSFSYLFRPKTIKTHLLLTFFKKRQLNRNIYRLNADLRKRDKRIKELEAELAKYKAPDKNAGNSSTPPSKEGIKDEAIRRTKPLRKPTGRTPGGQEGHDGSTLKTTRIPDETEEVKANYCTSASLEDCERILDYVTQVVSIPELKPIVKEIRHYITVCKNCGERVRVACPRKCGSNAVVSDATVKSLVVYLSVVMFLPYGHTENFFKEVFGLSISQGPFVNWINEANKNAAPAIEKIKECIMKSAVVSFDESSLYCNKKLDWTWIVHTVYFTLLFHGSGRSHKEIESRFGSSHQRMTAVTDRHSVYFTLNYLNHQACIAYLLRELQYLNDLDKEQQWSKKVESLLQETVHERNENPQVIIDKQPWLVWLDSQLKENLEHMKKQFRQLKQGLIKCRDYILNFLENPAIPPDKRKRHQESQDQDEGLQYIPFSPRLRCLP